MRVFDWERLLKEQRIPYIESGPNVKRGEMAIQCPFCGSADPSKHMGLSRETGWYSCWRNRSQHSGKSPLRLIMKLLRVPYGRAREIAGLGDDYVDPEGFDAMAARLMHRNDSTGRKEETQRRSLTLDPGFRVIKNQGGTRRFWEYLVDARNFRSQDIELLGADYGVCAALDGDYANRVIFPYYQDDELVTWTGRAIGSARIRYKDLSLDESILAPKETLFNHDAIYAGGEVLNLVEGPVDVLKLDFYGRHFGVRAVGLSTNSIKPEQAYLLQAASDRFKRIVIMLDNASKLGIVDSMRMKQELHFIDHVSIEPVPFNQKDAGALLPSEVEDWAEAQGAKHG